MFTNDNDYQYAIVRFNHTSDTTIQVELQWMKQKFQNYKSVQSMSMIWNIQETKQGYITNLVESHKERHQPRFRLV